MTFPRASFLALPVVVALAVVPVACGSDPSSAATPLLIFSDPPNPAAGTGGTSLGTSTGTGGGSGGSVFLAGGNGGNGGNGDSGTAGAFSGGNGGALPSGGSGGGPDGPDPTTDTRKTPQCDPKTPWGNGDAVPGVTGPGRTLAALTFDEQTIGWRQDDTPGTLFLSHRSSPAAPFPAPLSYVFPDGYGDDGRVALSTDGLRLVFARNDHLTFAQVVRTALDQSFSTTPDEAPFELVSRTAVASSWPVYGPAFSRSDLTLYYTYVPTVGPSRLMRATRQGTAWIDVIVVNDGYFDGKSPGEPRHVAGVAPDETALFLHTSPSGQASAVWSTLLSSNVETSVDFGNRHGIWANADCTRLYFSVDPGSGSRELRVATKP